MKRITVVCLVLVSALFILSSCKEEAAGNVKVTKMDGYKPNLPPVPSIPKPSAPETYSDGSYSVYGLRKNVGKTMNSQVEVTAYLVNIYQKPVCEEGQTCHTMMPHVYLADEQGEKLQKRQIRLVGFAQSFKEMEDEKENDLSGREPEELPEGVYLPPVVWDWRQGQKYKIKAVFVNRSSSGFMDADGLLEYKGHECLDCPAEEEK
ncbi:MAG: hypothetical protein JXX29_15880 [Deltaproteobacteria bacterium]|nr:hypothetical protein [Deltaproteobacteria bacterium]MBN2673161.1 hypothetical protein [Deltaproteobacteria bacterium]